MFINTRKSFKFTSDNGTLFEKRAGWIGEVPKWVEEHWYFKSLCKDGSVTAIVSSKDKDINAVLEAKPENDQPKSDECEPEATLNTPPVSVETKSGKSAKNTQ